MNDRYTLHPTRGSAAAAGPGARATVINYSWPPRYALRALPAPGPLDATWLMEQPSRLLDARSQVVGFRGREPELAQLREWRDSTGSRLSALLLHAPGGQGKTRLAAQLGAQSHDARLPASQRWQVLHAVPDDHPASLRGEELDLAEGDEAGVLVIIDYADRWSYGDLESLLSDRMLNQQCPTRVLMIGRTVRWFAAIRAGLADRHAATSDLPLRPLVEDRLSMFNAALHRYGAPDLYNLADASAIGPPAQLDPPDFGLTLTLHMAALVAVDARSRGESPPTQPHELSGYLLDREYQAWQRLFDAGRSGQDYHTRPTVMGKAVFTAVLTGAVSHTVATCAVRALDLPGHSQDILDDHRFCYPPADRRQVLEPLYPDRLAEDFLALLTPGHTISAYDPDPWTSTVPATLTSNQELRGVVTPRALTFLAAAAGRWPHLGQDVLYPLLRTDPRLAIDAGSAALTALAAIPAVPLDVLEAVAEHLPDLDQGDINLDVGSAAITQRLVDHQLTRTTDPAAQAGLYLVLGARLARAGDRPGALEATQRAVDWCRGLVDNNRSVYLQGLAAALNHLASHLTELGRPAEALAAAQEAVNLHLELMADDRGDLPLVAAAVDDLATSLGEMGQRDGAVSIAQQGVELNRELVELDRDTYLPRLAASVGNLAHLLGEAGRRDEALTAGREAVALSREVVRFNRNAYLPDLALWVNNLADYLGNGVGQQTEALASAREAVGLYRELVGINRGRYLSGLARSVKNFGARLADTGRRAEALTATLEAVGFYRELVELNRDAHLPGLAASLVDLAIRLAEASRMAETLATAQEAVGLYRELVELNRDTHLPGLAGSVNNLASYLHGDGRHAEALTPAEEAVELHRELVELNRDAHLARLAGSVNNLAAYLSGAGRHAEAPTPAEEAVELYRELAAGNGDVFLPRLAGAVNSLGAYLNGAGRHAEAVTATQQAVELHRDLVELNRSGYLPDLAICLTNLANQLTEVGHRAESLTAVQEAIDLRRELVADDRDHYLPGLARSLRILAADLSGAGRHAEALTPAEEAVEVYQELVQLSRGTYLPRLAHSVLDLTGYLSEAGRPAEALIAAEQSVELYRQLVELDPDTYLHYLAGSMYNLAIRLAEVGRLNEALDPAQVAIALRRELVANDRYAHLANLAISVFNFAAYLGGAGRPAEALPFAQEAVELYTELAELDRDVYFPDLAMSMNLASQLAESDRAVLRPSAATTNRPPLGSDVPPKPSLREALGAKWRQRR